MTLKPAEYNIFSTSIKKVVYKGNNNTYKKNNPLVPLTTEFILGCTKSARYVAP